MPSSSGAGVGLVPNVLLPGKDVVSRWLLPLVLEGALCPVCFILDGARSQSLTCVSHRQVLQGPGRTAAHVVTSTHCSLVVMAAQRMPVALQVVVLSVVVAASRPSPAASDGCPLGLLLLAAVLLAAVQVAVLPAVQVAVLSVVVVASWPSPAASDGCPLRLLPVVLLAPVQVAVLAAVQVAVLSVVVVASRPSPAASDG
ncbi:hypothetical protein NDU88_002995 [Pleurodeles waltl]|uniref:Uncharacterized protein n=1 Tax=Pleurodeles waltl TaxID=8319 RepID=A0AAV7WRS5_PLEWA|nr:hypothetical protein NDU88_002995 [Pleurodeles waltl]